MNGALTARRYYIEVQWGSGWRYALGESSSYTGAKSLKARAYARWKANKEQQAKNGSRRGAMPTFRIWSLVSEDTLPRPRKVAKELKK